MLDACPRQHVGVSVAEALGIGLVLGEQSEPEQHAVGVRPVVEVGAVVVRLEQPHVRVPGVEIETVAVGVGLGLQHQLVELGGTERAALAAGEQLRLEEEPGVDVDDHLGRADEGDVEQRQSLHSLQSAQAGLDRERLAEDARRLGQRHRQPALQWRASGERRVVVGVTELVRGRLGGVERARPVEQHQRAVVDERHAERTARLAVTRAGVDPAFVEGVVDEPGELVAVCRERRRAPTSMPSSHDVCVSGCGSGAIRSHHAQTALVAVSSGLASHPPAEVGERGGDRPTAWRRRSVG